MLVSILITICYISFLFIARNKKLNDLSLILITSIFIVSIFFPVLSYFYEPITWRNLSGYTLKNVEYVQMQYLSFIIGAILFYLTWGYKIDKFCNVESVNINNYRNALLVDKSSYLSVVLILIGSLLYIFYVQSIGIDTLINSKFMTDKYKSSIGKGFLNLGLNFVILGVLISESIRYGSNLKKIARILAFFVIVWALFFIQVRTYVAILIFGYLYIYIDRCEIKVSQLKIKYILGLIFIVILFELFSLLRSVISSDNSLDFENIFKFAISNIEIGISSIVGGSDISHPFITFMEISRHEQSGWMMGQGFVDGVMSILPSFVWDDKPQTMAQWFAAKYYSSFSGQGGGTGSTLVGEIWLNFGGFIAPLVAGFLISLFLFWVQLKGKLRSQGLIALSIPYFTFPLLFVERVGLVATFKHFIYIFVPLVLITITFKFLTLITKK